MNKKAAGSWFPGLSETKVSDTTRLKTIPLKGETNLLPQGKE